MIIFQFVDVALSYGRYFYGNVYIRDYISTCPIVSDPKLNFGQCPPTCCLTQVPMLLSNVENTQRE